MGRARAQVAGHEGFDAVFGFRRGSVASQAQRDAAEAEERIQAVNDRYGNSSIMGIADARGMYILGDYFEVAPADTLARRRAIEAAMLCLQTVKSLDDYERELDFVRFQPLLEGLGLFLARGSAKGCGSLGVTAAQLLQEASEASLKGPLAQLLNAFTTRIKEGVLTEGENVELSLVRVRSDYATELIDDAYASSDSS
jgi:hypothetical protein